MYRRRSNITNIDIHGTSTSAVIIIKELVSEIQCLQQENVQLRRLVASPRIKRCYRCGREGHLERACCERVTRYDGDWRASHADNSHANANELEDEGFGSPGKVMEPDVSHITVANQVSASVIPEYENDQPDACDDGADGGCARTRVYAGKCDQEASLEASIYSDSSSITSDRRGESSCDSDGRGESSCESEGEATESHFDDGIYDDAEDNEDAPTTRRSVSPIILDDGIYDDAEDTEDAPTTRRSQKSKTLHLLECINDDLEDPTIAHALGLVGKVFEQVLGPSG